LHLSSVRVLHSPEGRAAWPSLFICGAALSLLAASLLTGRWYQWAGVALLAFAGAPWRSLPANLLGLVTVSYCGWQLANAVFISPVYAAEGIYQPLMLLGAFAAFANLGRDRAVELFGAGVALLSGLVLLGLLQHFFGIWQLDFSVWHHEDNPIRAAATFVTPNSFATAINMFFVPLSALYVVRGSRRYLVLALWMFAGVVASQSRGGMLSWLAGLGFVAVCLGLPVLRRNSPRVLRLLVGSIAVWFAVAAADTFVFTAGETAREAATARWLGTGMAERPELYAATLGLIREHPVAGSGANMFYPLFESVKPVALRDSEYFYAHDDYLQAWLEFGAPGLALLLALAGSALIIVLRTQRRAPGDSLPLACGAGLASCFAHSVVDFPLYVPFILLLVGGYLGVLAAHAGGRLPAPAARFTSRTLDVVSPSIRWALALAGLLWLSQPMLAEMAVYRSIAVLQRGDAREGIYWQTVARRLEPRHPAHYWAEATIWREQALMTRNPLLAAQADALFAEGARVNKYDVANLLGRIEFHRRYPELLKQPASPAEILSWAEHAAALRPTNLAVQGELALALAYAGERARAHVLARTLLEQYPASHLARRLAAEL
jgi:O-antigen ligase